jgi:hypothetical protein
MPHTNTLTLYPHSLSFSLHPPSPIQKPATNPSANPPPPSPVPSHEPIDTLRPFPSHKNSPHYPNNPRLSVTFPFFPSLVSKLSLPYPTNQPRIPYTRPYQSSYPLTTSFSNRPSICTQSPTHPYYLPTYTHARTHARTQPTQLARLVPVRFASVRFDLAVAVRAAGCRIERGVVGEGGRRERERWYAFCVV